MILVREATLADAQEIRAMVMESIRVVCQPDYSPAQIEAWLKGASRPELWEAAINTQFTRIAIINSKIAGFATLEDHNYLDFLFVHPEFQGLGIATLLFAAIEAEAYSRGTKEITADVSITAKSFAQKMGFVVIAQQEVERHGEVLINFKIKKSIS